MNACLVSHFVIVMNVTIVMLRVIMLTVVAPSSLFRSKEPRLVKFLSFWNVFYEKSFLPFSNEVSWLSSLCVKKLTNSLVLTKSLPNFLGSILCLKMTIHFQFKMIYFWGWSSSIWQNCGTLLRAPGKMIWAQLQLQILTYLQKYFGSEYLQLLIFIYLQTYFWLRVSPRTNFHIFANVFLWFI